MQIFTISVKEIIHQLKLSCQIPSIVEGIVTRQFVIDIAAKLGITTETEELQKAADSLRLINNLRSANATLSWLEKYSLTLDDFEEAVYVSVLSSLDEKIRLQIISDLFADWVKQQVAAIEVELQLDNLERVLVNAGG